MNCDCGKCGKRAASIDWLFAVLIAVAVIIIVLTT